MASALSADGSWDHSVPLTIENLFALWLLVEEVYGPIHAAIDWLLEITNPPRTPTTRFTDFFCKNTSADNAGLRSMRNVPFTPGCSNFVKTGATLFLAMQFHRQDDEPVRKAYARVNQRAIEGNGRLCSGSCAHNLRLAMAVHPHYRKAEGMHHVLDYLFQHQQETGSWSAGIPFYPTLYLLSYLNVPMANSLFEKALARVQRSQRKDGSWGTNQKERDTFLVMDSLLRKGVEWTV